MKTRILYVEDELHLGKIVCETLEKQGFHVAWEPDGSKVMDRYRGFNPDICVLDIMLPGVDGYTLCSRIHNESAELPIIFLTAKTDTSDLVKGFEAGGSDYMKKPFSLEELIVRINNQLRLRNPLDSQESTDEEIRAGTYILRPGMYELVSPTITHRLSEKEMQILRILLGNKNRLTYRKNLLMTVWGDDSFFNTRNLDVYIKKIRNLLKEDSKLEIQTIKGVGHLFVER